MYVIFELKIRYISSLLVIPLPREWDPQPLDTKGRAKRVHLARLEMDSPEYQEVEKRFKESKGAEKVCD